MSRKKSVISKYFSDRLLFLMEKVGFGGRQNIKFANKVGVSSSFLSDVINLKSGPSFGLIYGITKNYPEININWLLTGEGSFFVKNGGNTSTDNPTVAGKMVEQQHMSLVKEFVDKQRALNIDRQLIELEKLDPETFKRVESYIKGTVDTVREVVKRNAPHPIERRVAQRRTEDDPDLMPDELDRRSGMDRRKTG